jgi:uncharacterized protein
MEKLNVKNLVLGEIGTTETAEVSDRLANEEFPEDLKVDKVTGKLKMIRLDETILVNGELKAEVELFCDRCLEAFRQEIGFNLDREYEINRLADSEENLFVDKYMNIDMTEPIREELILAVPMKKICKESCQGIRY